MKKAHILELKTPIILQNFLCTTETSLYCNLPHKRGSIFQFKDSFYALESFLSGVIRLTIERVYFILRWFLHFVQFPLFLR